MSLLTRGGPAGAAVGLDALDLSGAPLNSFLALGALDAIGEFVVRGTVPAGLSGSSLTLESFAIGFSGKAIDSQPRTLTFQ